MIITGKFLKFQKKYFKFCKKTKLTEDNSLKLLINNLKKKIKVQN